METVTRELPKSEWKAYFDRLSVAALHHQVEVQFEVVSLELGDQLKEQWTALRGISFDRNDDSIYVVTDPIVHQAQHPQKIQVIESDTKIETIHIVDQEGQSLIIKLKSPDRVEQSA
jgi:hypothetical protein